VLKLPDVRERMTLVGLDSAGDTTEEFAAFVKKDVAHWADLIKQAGIQPE
jgi:tripartite-type tricarboxylate transporter receptor subunit TctC